MTEMSMGKALTAVCSTSTGMTLPWPRLNNQANSTDAATTLSATHPNGQSGVHEVPGGATQRHKQVMVVRIDGRTTTREVRRNECRLVGDLKAPALRVVARRRQGGAAVAARICGSREGLSKMERRPTSALRLFRTPGHDRCPRSIELGSWQRQCSRNATTAATLLPELSSVEQRRG